MNTTHLSTALAFALATVASTQAAAQKVDVVTLPDSGIRIGGTGPMRGGLSHVCIDTTSHPSWMLVYAAPTEDAAKPCAKPGMRRVPIADFDTAATRRQLRGWLKHEIMPQMKVVDALIAAVKRNPRMPVGLTFEGGMAVTHGDYRAAEQRHAAWKADPSGYARTQWGLTRP